MKIIIADRYRLFREGLTSLIEQVAGFKVVAETVTGSQLLELAYQHQPDAILMEYELEDGSGIFHMKTVLAHFPNISFIILDNGLTNEHFLEAFLAGAKGVLEKTISKDILTSSLRALKRGEAVIPRSMVMLLLKELVDHKNPAASSGNGQDLGSLTYREIEVFKLLGASFSNREIAEQLIISENTVRVHVHNILDKLHLKSRREAAEHATRHYLLKIEATDKPPPASNAAIISQ